MGSRATNQIRPATEQIQRIQEDGGELAERGRRKNGYKKGSEMKGQEKKKPEKPEKR